jgi:arginyl-tRNA synthetase
MLIERLEEEISKIMKPLVGEDVVVRVMRPSIAGSGELSTNTPMQVFGKLKNQQKDIEFNTARDLAFEIKEKLEESGDFKKYVKEIEVAGPGFLNFYLTDEYLGDEFLRSEFEFDQGKGKKVLVEYSSPNIAKRFGVGHMRSTIVGQALLNSFAALGYETVGDNHWGDWGTQFGIIIAGVENENLDVNKMSVSDLEALYVRYNALIDENKEYKERAREAFKRLEEGESKAYAIWEASKNISIKEFDEIYKRINVKIDYAYGEAFYEQIMKDVVIPEVGKKLGKVSEGATIVEFENLPPAMLLKTNGTTTYFTRDLATIYFRQNNPELKSDLYIYEVGAEQELHFKQVFEAASMMGWIKREQLVHVAHGLMRLPEGKISTRKGRNIKLEDLLDGAVVEAKTKIRAEVNENEAEKLSQIVGMGAVKFNELKHSPRTDYIFKMEEAMSLEGDSGPYVMYAVVRARAILDKVTEEMKGNFDSALNEDERKMISLMLYYPSIVSQIAVSYAPNLLCAYLLELSGTFNQFYTNNPVLKADKEKIALRIAITEKFVTIASQGLSILGISIPERM